MQAVSAAVRARYVTHFREVEEEQRAISKPSVPRSERGM